MKLIRNFEIDTNDLSALQESKSFKVRGDDGAVFSLQIKTSTGKFYNFKSKLFETTITSEHRLTNQSLIGKSYSGEILFPADTDGETYTILLTAEPHFDTKITDSLIGNVNNSSLEYNPVLYQIDIVQVADVVVTFAPVAVIHGNYTSATLAQTTTITKSPTITTPTTTTVSWTIANAATDGEGFGLVSVLDLKAESSDLIDGVGTEIGNENWYASTTAVIDDTQSDDGGGSTHYNYIVDDISDLAVDMQITAISSGTLGSAPTLTRVAISDNFNRFIKMNAQKAFADGITLTLKGYGINTIDKATGCNVILSNFKLIQTPLTTTVRGAVSGSTAITVNGTYGISKDAYFEGFGVDNSVDNPVRAVPTPSSSAGTITSTTNQTLADNTTLNIIGSSSSYTVTGDITLNKMPTSNTTIYLDLDKLLTVGTAS